MSDDRKDRLEAVAVGVFDAATRRMDGLGLDDAMWVMENVMLRIMSGVAEQSNLPLADVIRWQGGRFDQMAEHLDRPVN